MLKVDLDEYTIVTFAAVDGARMKGATVSVNIDVGKVTKSSVAFGKLLHALVAFAVTEDSYNNLSPPA